MRLVEINGEEETPSIDGLALLFYGREGERLKGKIPTRPAHVGPLVQPK